jgi:hypothetical protein
MRRFLSALALLATIGIGSPLVAQNCEPAACGPACGPCGPGCCHNGLCHHPPKHGNASAEYRAGLRPWHGGYYYTQWGAPVALVVPPTAEFQTDYSWGVPASRRGRIDHQFHHGFPGYGYGGSYGFLATPQFPNDTRQFGVYSVRGPW